MTNPLLSPDGNHLARLEYESEIRFGPEYYRLSVDDRSLGSRLFGQPALWSEDSRLVALQEWLTVDYASGPRTRLLVLDVDRWLQATFPTIERGFVEAIAFGGGGVDVKCSYLGAGVTVERRYDLPPGDLWAAVGFRTAE